MLRLALNTWGSVATYCAVWKIIKTGIGKDTPILDKIIAWLARITNSIWAVIAIKRAALEQIRTLRTVNWIQTNCTILDVARRRKWLVDVSKSVLVFQRWVCSYQQKD